MMSKHPEFVSHIDIVATMSIQSLLTASPHFAQPAMSIIIPAHNEEAVLERCLRHLLNGARRGELDVVVVCNGCTDRTAEIARNFGNAVRVFESTVPSKIAALNLGDQMARTFPRIYVDADVTVSIESLRATAAVLRYGRYLAAAPEVKWDLSRSNWLVRAFYAVWQLQPYFDAGRLGAGVYALSTGGHARLVKFPQVTADDEYVRRLFTPEERITVTTGTFLVTPPRTLRDLIQIKTRSRRGNMELVQRFPHLSRMVRESRWKFISRIARRPWLWLSSLVYLAVVIQTTIRARRTLKPNGTAAWERDLSSRTTTESDHESSTRS